MDEQVAQLKTDLEAQLENSAPDNAVLSGMLTRLGTATTGCTGSALEKLLQSTGVGKLVNKIRKRADLSTDVRSSAKSMVNTWKEGVMCSAETEWPTTDKKVEWPPNQKRVRKLGSVEHDKAGDCVVYWMSRDQRAQDNWALLYASHLAQKQQRPLVVLFSLVPKFLNATIRQYGFMLKGLEETASVLRGKNVPFTMLSGYAKDTVRRPSSLLVMCSLDVHIHRIYIYAALRSRSLSKTNIPAAF
jgi:hypothetical protein